MLRNKTKKNIIAKDVRVLSKTWEIYSGLMFRRKLKSYQAYNFLLPKTKRWDITMFFVFQTIDLVFCLDGKVVELKESLKPFSHYFSKKKSNQLLELSEGSIKSLKIDIGDIILK